MWKCPICSIEEKSEYICRNCGYDVRKDFVRNRTIQPVPPQDAKTFAKWISNHDEAQRQKADEAVRVLLDVIKREQEKKAEAERRAEEERKAREAEAARKVEEERKTREAEAARKAEEERKAREAEAARKAEEERKMREAEAARKAEEESRARAAEAARRSAERARKESEERQKVHQTYTEKKQKKSSKGLKLAAKFVLFSAVFGVIGAVTGSMNDDEGMYSSNSNEEAYSSYNSGTSYNMYRPEFDSVEEEWGYVVQTIKDSLKMDGIDYRTDSLDAISDFWRSCGYDVEVNPMTYDEENGYESGNVSGNDGYAYFGCHDIKDAYSLGRYLTFSSHTKEYDSLNCIAPLAFGIQFGDSYQVVCEKLGITEEMVFYLSEAERANDVSIILDEPGGESVSITVNFDDCYFSYFFDEQTYEFRTLFVDGYTYNEEPYDMENDIDVTENPAHGWDDIVQTSIDALQYGHIDYIGDSHEDIVNMLETDGFEQDESNTTIDNQFKSFTLGNDRYKIYIRDVDQSFDYDYRSLEFAYCPQFGEDPDGILKPVFLNDVPLPYGITFDDSFDTVCKKLGITEEMLLEVENMENLFVDIQSPDSNQENVVDIVIYYTNASGEHYDFTYYFYRDGSYLAGYRVGISY